MSDAPTDTPPAAAAAATAADPAAEKAAADSSAAAAAVAKDPVHTIGGTEYKYLADGKYDVIICGTGTTECILSGLCAVNKKKVRQTSMLLLCHKGHT